MWEILSRISKKEYYGQEIHYFSIEDATVKEDESLELNKFWDPDSSKSYVTRCGWESLTTLANCELVASFGVIYINITFFFYFLFKFTGVFKKNFFFLFFFFFWQCSRSLNYLACFLDYEVVAKIGQNITHILPMQR
jgi:hypothetical protein